MPNHLDLLLAVDEVTRASQEGKVLSGFDMYSLAAGARLVEWGDLTPARWTGELVQLGYLTHGPRSPGDPRPIPPGAIWGDTELQRFDDFFVTPLGRDEADRMRRLERESATDASLGHQTASLVQPWMTDAQERAILGPLHALRVALDGEQHVAAVGAAKDLVEAACKVALEQAGSTISGKESLPALFKRATSDGGAEGDDAGLVGRSLASTVQRLAELRNVAGAGHGHASVLEMSGREARLAASAASGVADFVLTGC